LARLSRDRGPFGRRNESGGCQIDSDGRRDTLAQRGQTLVEFALVIPIFMVLLMATIEFGLAFNALLDVDYASRNAALLAAEAGNTSGADCVILQSVEQDINAPADRNAIQKVEIYWADADGTMHGTNENVYTRGGGTTSCTYPDGSTISVPYVATSIGYVDISRCNALKGCGSAHPELDTIGVRITYKHTWRTPAAAFIGQTGSGFTIVDSNAMRMEPIL